MIVTKMGEVIPMEYRLKVSHRYKEITRVVNNVYWNIASEALHSLYVGSYGRGTAIKTSDIDILIEFPVTEFNRFDNYKFNGQSQLLQSLRTTLLDRYPSSKIEGDGQVVKFDFSDGVAFELLPAFRGCCGYVYPDSNGGGKWRSTRPREEQEAMRNKNNVSNGLLFDTCKHIRSLRDNHFQTRHLSGILIDSFVYKAIGDWVWSDCGRGSAVGAYEKSLLNCFYMTFGAMLFDSCQYRIDAPGSGDGITCELEDVKCLGNILEKMATI